MIAYGDLMLRSYILRDLLETEAEFCVVVDSAQAHDQDTGSTSDFVVCTEPDDRSLFGRRVLLSRMTTDAGVGVHGRWIGLLAVRDGGSAKLRATLEGLGRRADFDGLDVPDLLNALVEEGEEIEVLYIHGHWRGINDMYDLDRAGEFARS